MALHADRRKLLLLVAFLAMAALAGCSGTHYPMCWSCDEGIDAAVSNGSGAPVTSTELEIQLLSDGDARWHVRATLDPDAAARLAENRSRLERIGERAVYGDRQERRHSAIDADRISNVSTILRDETLHLRFRVDDFAEQRRGELLFVDAFQGRGEVDPFDVGADRLVLRGPNGTVLLNDPPSVDATPDDRTLVWNDTQGVSENMYVVYGEHGGPAERALAQGYVAVDVFGWVGPRLLPAVPFVLLWGGALLVVQVFVNRIREGVTSSSPSDLLRVRLAGTIGLLAALTWYAIATGTRVPLWVGWFPTLPLGLFAAHALAVAADSEWRHELLICVAAVPLLTVASSAGVPGARAYAIGEVVRLTGLTFTGLALGGGVWGLIFVFSDEPLRDAVQ